MAAGSGGQKQGTCEKGERGSVMKTTRLDVQPEPLPEERGRLSSVQDKSRRPGVRDT